MPWSVERSGSAVHVRLELPIRDWEVLFDAIQAEIAQKTSEITIQAELPGASRTDANMLEMLRRALSDSGIPLT